MLWEARAAGKALADETSCGDTVATEYRDAECAQEEDTLEGVLPSSCTHLMPRDQSRSAEPWPS